ncbi:aminotransferase class I/II-fold pyridoxal phosphate-dependent enzyme [Sphingobacterium suaedae]|uniref:Aminotransferase class I/II-fold pyridoxal phosphate-dependent enzyme n=1 Tax=Sphingobacterium suaedae TaxID=1686402 RepID=A0ABW5KCI5_9SPHI
MRNFQNLTQSTGRLVTAHQENYLFFGGTAYLGLMVDPEYIEIYKQGIDRYGLNNGTSRNNNIQLGVYGEAEENLAERFRFDACLLLSSGYLAAQMCIHFLGQLGEICYAPHAHPALWKTPQKSTTIDFSSWARQTVAYINASAERTFVIVSNTLDNLTPAVYDFSIFGEISETKQIYFLLDDSHGIGVREANSCFIDINVLRGKNREIIVVASLAKGMGTDAGAVFCSKAMAQLFRTTPFFTGASPAAPAALYALMEGEQVYRKQVIQLQRNIQLLRGEASLSLKSLPGFPVFTLEMPEAFAQLAQKQILISSFPYPLPQDPVLNRIVLSALHNPTDLERLVSALKSLE